MFLQVITIFSLKKFFFKKVYYEDLVQFELRFHFLINLTIVHMNSPWLMCRIPDYHPQLNLRRLRQSKFLLVIYATTYCKNHSPNQNTGDDCYNNNFELIIPFYLKILFVSLKNAKLKSGEKEDESHKGEIKEQSIWQLV